MDWKETLCIDCNHKAKDHVTYTGPCSECWRQAVKICERFHPTAEAIELIEQAADAL